jgi:hypothetical protein
MEIKVRVMPIDQQDRARREDALRMTPEERVEALLRLRDRMFPPAPLERIVTIRSLH